MSNLLIATPLSDGATITGTSPDSSGLPLSNLQTFHPHQKYISSSASSTSIVVDLLSAMEVGMVFLGYTNLTSSDTYRVRGATSQSNLTSSPGEDTGNVTFDAQGYNEPHLLHLFDTSKTYRWWRIDVSTGSKFQAGRLYISNPWRATINTQYGQSFDINDQSVIKRSRGGQPYVNQKTVSRIFTGTLKHQSEADAMGALYQIYTSRGNHKDVVLCANPDSQYLRDETIYGLLDVQPIINQSFGLFENKITVEEIPDGS